MSETILNGRKSTGTRSINHRKTPLNAGDRFNIWSFLGRLGRDLNRASLAVTRDLLVRFGVIWRTWHFVTWYELPRGTKDLIVPKLCPIYIILKFHVRLRHWEKKLPGRWSLTGIGVPRCQTTSSYLQFTSTPANQAKDYSSVVTMYNFYYLHIYEAIIWAIQQHISLTFTNMYTVLKTMYIVLQHSYNILTIVTSLQNSKKVMTFWLLWRHRSQSGGIWRGMLDLFKLNCAPQYHWSDFIKFITNSRVVRNEHFELYSSNSYTSIFIRNIQSAITTNDGIDLFNKNFFYISGTLLTLSDFLDLHQNGFHNSDFGRKTESASAVVIHVHIHKYR